MPELSAVVLATKKLLSPSAPQVLSRLGSATPELEGLRAAIEVDPVLTVKIINHANHSFYARQVPVSSLRAALARLGWDTSRELLAHLLVETAFQRVDPRLGRPVWEHSLRVAVLSRLLARQAGRIDPSLVYTTGLVHGIGQLGLAALLREPYVALWQRAPSGPHLARLEREKLGYDHAKVGAGVLAELSLPDAIPAGVARMYQARLASKDWTARHDLLVAALLQLTHSMLYDIPGRLTQPGWIREQPLAQRLGVHGCTDLGARFQAALDRQLDKAA